MCNVLTHCLTSYCIALIVFLPNSSHYFPNCHHLPQMKQGLIGSRFTLLMKMSIHRVILVVLVNEFLIGHSLVLVIDDNYNGRPEQFHIPLRSQSETSWRWRTVALCFMCRTACQRLVFAFPVSGRQWGKISFTASRQHHGST